MRTEKMFWYQYYFHLEVYHFHIWQIERSCGYLGTQTWYRSAVPTVTRFVYFIFIIIYFLRFLELNPYKIRVQPIEYKHILISGHLFSSLQIKTVLWSIRLFIDFQSFPCIMPVWKRLFVLSVASLCHWLYRKLSHLHLTQSCMAGILWLNDYGMFCFTFVLQFTLRIQFLEASVQSFFGALFWHVNNILSYLQCEQCLSEPFVFSISGHHRCVWNSICRSTTQININKQTKVTISGDKHFYRSKCWKKHVVPIAEPTCVFPWWYTDIEQLALSKDLTLISQNLILRNAIWFPTVN